jgi:GNAT superfamily N-acetyltransferase
MARAPALFGRLYGDDWRHQQREDVEKTLRDEKSEVLVAEVDGEVAGFVSAVVDANTDMGEIYTWWRSIPASRITGLGTQLTDVATDWLRNAGMAVVLVSTGGDIGHAPARRTYEKVGFTPMPVVNYFNPREQVRPIADSPPRRIGWMGDGTAEGGLLAPRGYATNGSRSEHPRPSPTIGIYIDW